jgi:hypothetical protein
VSSAPHRLCRSLVECGSDESESGASHVSIWAIWAIEGVRNNKGIGVRDDKGVQGGEGGVDARGITSPCTGR